ncbi:MAG: redoxin domain-containing protein [Phycisphaerales bacterium]|nr:MAG: redoxin domain-containing protein [Phycisphaerales bacterium]
MNKRTKMRRSALILVGAVALCIVGAFAVVSNRPVESENVSRTLEDVIKTRQTWDVAFEEWFGRAAPDFKLKDIEGVEHKLSDYKGRDVLVVFWATWCPACNVEIPHLIKLRKEFKREELVILAISSETVEHLKHFAAAKGINYSVVPLGENVLPEPFSNVRSIPTNFFIDKNGNVKLAALGLVSLEDSRAILTAEL